MRKLTRNLYNIDCILNETRGVGCIITEEDMRYIEAIRLELTNLAGPEDIDAVKFIKAELNKNYGVAAIPCKYNIDSWVEAVRQENLTNLSFKFDNNKSKKDENIEVVKLMDVKTMISIRNLISEYLDNLALENNK